MTQKKVILDMPITELTLMIKHQRKRIGCDACHKNPSTQFFAGYLGDGLWICEPCFEKMTGQGMGGRKRGRNETAS